jgi:hypothetical protein
MNLSYIDSIFDKVKRPVYIYSVILAHIIYISVAFGLLVVQKEYINYLNVFTQSFVAGFLILRFHPFRKHEYKEGDGILLFGAGIFLLTNIGISNLLLSTITRITDNIVR